MTMSERWRVEDLHEAVWLVRPNPWGHPTWQSHAEMLTPTAAAARLGAWFPAGCGSRDQLLADVCLSLEGTYPGSDVPESGWLHEVVRRALHDGRLVALRATFPPPVEGFAEETDGPVPSRDVLESIRIVVVEDKTWKPISGVTLNVTLPNGVERLGTSGSDGSIEHWNVPQGSCGLASAIDGCALATSFEVVALDHGEPPSPMDEEPIKGAEKRRFAVAIRRHRVTRGDSLESVAHAFGLTWQQLAQFNFGTSNPTDVSRHLRVDLGCRRRIKDPKSHVFDDADDPGLLYAPAAWARIGLATDRTYTLRLRIPVIVKPKKNRFLFSI